MISEDVQSMSSSPLVNEFVLAIIKTIKSKNLIREEKHIIHADMVPKFSEKVIQASLNEKQIFPHKQPQIQPPQIQPKRTQMNNLIAPIEKPKPISQPRMMPQMRPPQPLMRMPQPHPAPQQPPVQQMQQQPQIPQPQSPQGYGKITPLLNDPSVSSIECSGAGKPVTIIRAGQKQMTKIILTPKEIKEILQHISEEVHIPLLEGVFRAAVENFSINAVISEMIGSRFVIKKQNAYSIPGR